MPINFNSYAITDFETGGLGSGCQPLSIGTVIIDPRRLTIADNGLFYSLIRPQTDEECEISGLDPIDPKALAVNKLNIEDLKMAPTLKTVWANYMNFMKYHNIKGDKWNAPIFTGWNAKYDHDITERVVGGHLPSKLTLHSKLIPKKDHKDLGDKELSKAYKALKFMKEPYGFGGDTLFRPFPVIDVAQVAFIMFESLREPDKLRLDTVKEFMGFKAEGAHNALVDCLWTAEIWVRYLTMFRQIAPEVDYETEGKTILDINGALSLINFAPKAEPINNTSLNSDDTNNTINSENDLICPF